MSSTESPALDALLQGLVVEEGERRVRGDEWICEPGPLPPRYGLSVALDPGSAGILRETLSSLVETSSTSSFSSPSSSSRRVARLLVDLLRTYSSQLSDAIIEWSDFAGEAEASNLQARTLEILSSLVALTRWYAYAAGSGESGNSEVILGLPVQQWSLHDIAGSFGLQLDGAKATPQGVQSNSDSSSSNSDSSSGDDGYRARCFVEDDLAGLLLSLLRKLLLFPSRTPSTTTAAAVLECQVLHVLMLLARGCSIGSASLSEECDFLSEFGMSDGPTVATRMLARNLSAASTPTQTLQALLVLKLAVQVAGLECERGSWDLTIQLGGAVGLALRTVSSHEPPSSAPITPLAGRVRLWTPRSFGDMSFPSQVWPWAGSGRASSSANEATSATLCDGPSLGFYITEAMQQDGTAVLAALIRPTDDKACEGAAGAIAQHLLSSGPSPLLSLAWDMLFRLVCPEQTSTSRASSSSSSSGSGSEGDGARKSVLLAVVEAIASPAPAGVSIGGMPLAHFHFTLFALRLMSTLGPGAFQVLRDGGCTSLLARMALQGRALPGGECAEAGAGIATEWTFATSNLGSSVADSTASSSLVDLDLPPVGLIRSQSLPTSDRASAHTSAQLAAAAGLGLEACLLRDLQWEVLHRCVAQGGPAEIDSVLAQMQLVATSASASTSTSNSSSSPVASIPEDVLAQALAWLLSALRLVGNHPKAEGLPECFLSASRAALVVARAQLVATGSVRERVERGGSGSVSMRGDRGSVHHTPPRTLSGSGGLGGAGLGLLAPPGPAAVASSRRGSSASGAALTGSRIPGSATPLSSSSGAPSPRTLPYHWHSRARALRLLQALASGSIHPASRLACADAFLPSPPTGPASAPPSASIPGSAYAPVISASNTVLRLCLDPRYRPAALDVLSSLLHTCAGPVLEQRQGDRGSADDGEDQPSGTAVCPYEPLAHDVLKSMLALIRAAPRIAIRTRGAGGPPVPALSAGAAGVAAEGGVRYLCTPYEDQDSFGAAVGCLQLLTLFTASTGPAPLTPQPAHLCLFDRYGDGDRATGDRGASAAAADDGGSSGSPAPAQTLMSVLQGQYGWSRRRPPFARELLSSLEVALGGPGGGAKTASAGGSSSSSSSSSALEAAGSRLLALHTLALLTCLAGASATGAAAGVGGSHAASIQAALLARSPRRSADGDEGSYYYYQELGSLMAECSQGQGAGPGEGASVEIFAVLMELMLDGHGAGAGHSLGSTLPDFDGGGVSAPWRSVGNVRVPATPYSLLSAFPEAPSCPPPACLVRTLPVGFFPSLPVPALAHPSVALLLLVMLVHAAPSHQLLVLRTLRNLLHPSSLQGHHNLLRLQSFRPVPLLLALLESNSRPRGSATIAAAEQEQRADCNAVLSQLLSLLLQAEGVKPCLRAAQRMGPQGGPIVRALASLCPAAAESRLACAFAFAGPGAGLALAPLARWPAPKGFTLSTWFCCPAVLDEAVLLCMRQETGSTAGVEILVQSSASAGSSGCPGHSIGAGAPAASTALVVHVYSLKGVPPRTVRVPIRSKEGADPRATWHHLSLSLTAATFRSAGELALSLDGVLHTHPIAMPSIETVRRPCLGDRPQVFSSGGALSTGWREYRPSDSGEEKPSPFLAPDAPNARDSLDALGSVAVAPLLLSSFYMFSPALREEKLTAILALGPAYEGIFDEFDSPGAVSGPGVEAPSGLAALLVLALSPSKSLPTQGTGLRVFVDLTPESNPAHWDSREATVSSAASAAAAAPDEIKDDYMGSQCLGERGYLGHCGFLHVGAHALGGPRLRVETSLDVRRVVESLGGVTALLPLLLGLARGDGAGGNCRVSDVLVLLLSCLQPYSSNIAFLEGHDKGPSAASKSATTANAAIASSTGGMALIACALEAVYSLAPATDVEGTIPALLRHCDALLDAFGGPDLGTDPADPNTRALPGLGRDPGIEKMLRLSLSLLPMPAFARAPLAEQDSLYDYLVAAEGRALAADGSAHHEGVWRCDLAQLYAVLRSMQYPEEDPEDIRASQVRVIRGKVWAVVEKQMRQDGGRIAAGERDGTTAELETSRRRSHSNARQLLQYIASQACGPERLEALRLLLVLLGGEGGVSEEEGVGKAMLALLLSLSQATQSSNSSSLLGGSLGSRSGSIGRTALLAALCFCAAVSTGQVGPLPAPLPACLGVAVSSVAAVLRSSAQVESTSPTSPATSAASAPDAPDGPLSLITSPPLPQVARSGDGDVTMLLVMQAVQLAMVGESPACLAEGQGFEDAFSSLPSGYSSSPSSPSFSSPSPAPFMDPILFDSQEIRTPSVLPVLLSLLHAPTTPVAGPGSGPGLPPLPASMRLRLLLNLKTLCVSDGSASAVLSAEGWQEALVDAIYRERAWRAGLRKSAPGFTSLSPTREASTYLADKSKAIEEVLVSLLCALLYASIRSVAPLAGPESSREEGPGLVLAGGLGGSQCTARLLALLRVYGEEGRLDVGVRGLGGKVLRRVLDLLIRGDGSSSGTPANPSAAAAAAPSAAAGVSVTGDVEVAQVCCQVLDFLALPPVLALPSSPVGGSPTASKGSPVGVRPSRVAGGASSTGNTSTLTSSLMASYSAPALPASANQSRHGASPAGGGRDAQREREREKERERENGKSASNTWSLLESVFALLTRPVAPSAPLAGQSSKSASTATSTGTSTATSTISISSIGSIDEGWNLSTHQVATWKLLGALLEVGGATESRARGKEEAEGKEEREGKESRHAKALLALTFIKTLLASMGGSDFASFQRIYVCTRLLHMMQAAAKPYLTPAPSLSGNEALSERALGTRLRPFLKLCVALLVESRDYLSRRLQARSLGSSLQSSYDADEGESKEFRSKEAPVIHAAEAEAAAYTDVLLETFGETFAPAPASERTRASSSTARGSSSFSGPNSDIDRPESLYTDRERVGQLAASNSSSASGSGGGMDAVAARALALHVWRMVDEALAAVGAEPSPVSPSAASAFASPTREGWTPVRGPPGGSLHDCIHQAVALSLLLAPPVQSLSLSSPRPPPAAVAAAAASSPMSVSAPPSLSPSSWAQTTLQIASEARSLDTVLLSSILTDLGMHRHSEAMRRALQVGQQDLQQAVSAVRSLLDRGRVRVARSSSPSPGSSPVPSAGVIGAEEEAGMAAEREGLAVVLAELSVGCGVWAGVDVAAPEVVQSALVVGQGDGGGGDAEAWCLSPTEGLHRQRRSFCRVRIGSRSQPTLQALLSPAGTEPKGSLAAVEEHKSTIDASVSLALPAPSDTAPAPLSPSASIPIPRSDSFQDLAIALAHLQSQAQQSLGSLSRDRDDLGAGPGLSMSSSSSFGGQSHSRQLVDRTSDGSLREGSQRESLSLTAGLSTSLTGSRAHLVDLVASLARYSNRRGQGEGDDDEGEDGLEGFGGEGAEEGDRDGDKGSGGVHSGGSHSSQSGGLGSSAEPPPTPPVSSTPTRRRSKSKTSRADSRSGVTGPTSPPGPPHTSRELPSTPTQAVSPHPSLVFSARAELVTAATSSLCPPVPGTVCVTREALLFCLDWSADGAGARGDNPAQDEVRGVEASLVDALSGYLGPAREAAPPGPSSASDSPTTGLAPGFDPALLPLLSALGIPPCSLRLAVAAGDIVQVAQRSYQLRFVAIEVFSQSRAPVFFTLLQADQASAMHQALRSLYPRSAPLLQPFYGAKPRTVIQKMRLPQRPEATLQQAWRAREISNFEYIMHLNTIAGRTYNDLGQYPIFPWVLADYSSAQLRLTDRASFRDLRYPMGAQSAEQRRGVHEKYAELDAAYQEGLLEHHEAQRRRQEAWEAGEDGEQSRVFSECPSMPPFHWGSHYSVAGFVLWYLVRMEPYTSLHVQLQDGRFDRPDRLFASLAATFKSCTTNPSDVKELTPEFFYLPDVLRNTNRLDLGVTQAGQRVDDVALPPWCVDADDFVFQHREALESEYVSANLHHWIDLVFGFRQKPPFLLDSRTPAERLQAAVERCNVFFHLTYGDAVDLDRIYAENPLLYEQYVCQISEFGQIPSQLFVEPHKPRLSLAEADLIWPIASCVRGAGTEVSDDGEGATCTGVGGGSGSGVGGGGASGGGGPTSPSHPSAPPATPGANAADPVGKPRKMVSYPPVAVSAQAVVFLAEGPQGRLYSLDACRLLAQHRWEEHSPDLVPPFSLKLDKLGHDLSVSALAGRGTYYSPRGPAGRSLGGLGLERINNMLDYDGRERRIEGSILDLRGGGGSSNVGNCDSGGDASAAIVPLRARALEREERLRGYLSMAPLPRDYDRAARSRSISASGMASTSSSAVSGATSSSGSSKSDAPPHPHLTAHVPDSHLTPGSVAIDHEARLFFSSGHWDGTVKATSLESGRLVQALAHGCVATCLAAGRVGTQAWLASGCVDGTVRLWRIAAATGAGAGSVPPATAGPSASAAPVSSSTASSSSANSATSATNPSSAFSSSLGASAASSALSTQPSATGSAATTAAAGPASSLPIHSAPLFTLVCHDASVTCLALSAELDLLCSGAADGIIHMHALRSGAYLRSLSHAVPVSLGLFGTTGGGTPTKQRRSLSSLLLSSAGYLVSYSFDAASPASSSLCSFTLQGQSLGCKVLQERLLALILSEDQTVLLTGGTHCLVALRYVRSLELASDGPRDGLPAVLDGGVEGGLKSAGGSEKSEKFDKTDRPETKDAAREKSQKAGKSEKSAKSEKSEKPANSGSMRSLKAGIGAVTFSVQSSLSSLGTHLHNLHSLASNLGASSASSRAPGIDVFRSPIRSLLLTRRERHLIVGLQSGEVRVLTLDSSYLRRRLQKKLKEIGIL